MIDIGKEGTLWIAEDFYYGDEVEGDFLELTLLDSPGGDFILSVGDILVLANCLVNGNDNTYLDGERELQERLEYWIEGIEEKIDVESRR